MNARRLTHLAVAHETLVIPPSGMLCPKLAARWIGGVSERTLEGWRRRGTGPRFVRIEGSGVRYLLADLESWRAEQVRTGT